MSPQHEASETRSEKACNYRGELVDILSRQLNPESIDSYANDALDDLISLVQKTTDSFSLQNIDVYDSARQMESAAFEYYELGDVETVLDNIADKVDEISQIDRIIDGATICKDIIIPTDKSPKITEGKGGFETNGSIPRLKTVLFVLSNDFDVDLNNSDQINLKKGLMADEMVRHDSYYLIEAPVLKRTILVCDEEGNATYVFNNSLMNESNITSVDLQKMTKSELSDLITETPLLGSKMRYSNHFVPRLIATIDDPGISPEDLAAAELREGNSYLCPVAPDDVRSMSSMSGYLKLDKGTVTDAIAELKEELGSTSSFRFNGHVATGYTTEQQAIIEKYCEDKGLLVDVAPEGYLSLMGIVKTHPFGYDTAQKAIEELGEKIGLTESFRFKQARAIGYSPDQQQIILDHLDENDKLFQHAPEGYRSCRGMAADIGVDKKTVSRAIKKLGDKIGQTEKYRFHRNKATGYSPEQQDIIKNYFSEKWSLKDRVKSHL
ncbi:MAG: hypothetical protein WCK26_01750 [Candidatus Saccharibacteria bacterium]